MTTLIEQFANFARVAKDTPEEIFEVFKDHIIGSFSSQELPGLSLLMMRDGSGRLLVDQTKAFLQFETIAELAEQAALYDEEQPRLGVARFVLGLLGEVLAMADGENDDD